MKQRDPKLIVLLFNESISRRDAETLAELMHEDYRFIDSNGQTHGEGKARGVEDWRRFFELYPDYRNHFQLVHSDGDTVAIAGHSTCSFEPLAGPALWSARVVDDTIIEWRVYLDTDENRRLLGLPMS